MEKLMSESSEYIPVAELAERLGIPLVSTYFHIRRGVFPAARKFGRILVKRADVPEIEQIMAIRKKFKG